MQSSSCETRPIVRSVIHSAMPSIANESYTGQKTARAVVAVTSALVRRLANILCIDRGAIHRGSVTNARVPIFSKTCRKSTRRKRSAKTFFSCCGGSARDVYTVYVDTEHFRVKPLEKNKWHRCSPELFNLTVKAHYLIEVHTRTRQELIRR